MAAKFLATYKITDWLEEISGTYRTFVPVREGQAIVFKPFAPGTEPELSVRPTTSAKSAVFPQCEPLMLFKYTKDPENLGKVNLEITEKKDSTPSVVVGCRGCDAVAFNTFDRVYVKKEVTDQNYLARRENTLFVSMVCEKPASTCFCNWTGGGPANTEGSDVQMTPVGGGWVFEAVTKAGEKLLESSVFRSGKEQEKEAKEVKKKAESLMQKAPDLSTAPEKILALFDNNEFWEAISAKCVSCGACTYLCPTCYCFNITDEACGMEGVRLRTWDNCMSNLFTMEASGHNPRPSKANRLKNRVGHKFSYYPSIHGGNIACVGCGRCIRSCPVSVDIRSIVLNAMAAPVAEAEK